MERLTMLSSLNIDFSALFIKKKHIYATCTFKKKNLNAVCLLYTAFYF